MLEGPAAGLDDEFDDVEFIFISIFMNNIYNTSIKNGDFNLTALRKFILIACILRCNYIHYLHDVDELFLMLPVFRVFHVEVVFSSSEKLHTGRPTQHLS